MLCGLCTYISCASGTTLTPLLRPQAILLICAFIGAGTNIFIAASHKIEDKLGVRYLYISVTLFNESLKFVTVTAAYLLQRCCGCFGGTSGATHSGHGRITVRESLLFAVPAFLYMFDNNLIFVILRYVDPPTVAILWNIKILITAILFRLTFKKAFSRQKWIAVFLLLVGCITSQADKVAKTKPGSCAAKEQLAANITSTSHFVHDGGLHSVLKHKVTGTTHADMASNAVSDTGSGGTSSWMIGLLLILLGTTVTSLAGVYSEWVLKNTAKLPFFLQNMQMNGYGVLCNGIALVTLHWQDLVERGIFSGYNRFTAYTIVCQASFGILTAAGGCAASCCLFR